MMRRGLAVLAGLAALAFPAVAEADLLGLPQPLLEQLPPQLRAKVVAAPARPSSSFHPAFELKADGYRVRVTSIGSSVAIEVERGRRAPTTAYLARGVVSPHRLRASFGKYGSVAMSFRPAPRELRKAAGPRSCRSTGGLLVQHGVFVGSFRFRGEDDYLSLRSHRAKGTVSRLLPRCPSGHRFQRRALRRGGASTGGAEPEYLVSSWRQGVNGASFNAIAFGSNTLYTANVEQSEGAVAKLHFAFVLASSATFALDDPLTFARLSPPKPFSGSGTYRAAPDGSKTWQGALAIDFPGLRHYHLAGPPFKPTLEASF